ncbi:MAG: YqgE/AlgH family protein [Magnetococcus sp. DMHC-6]
MIKGSPLVGQFLIAMPSLKDPQFERSVMILCAHSQEGALGLVINQPHPAKMAHIAQQLGLNWRRPGKQIVYQGGPVAMERGFILYEDILSFPGHLEIVPNLFMGTNPDILSHLARPDASERFLFALGYAGWAEGQLEAELRENVWLMAPLDRRILFDLPPSERWTAAIDRLGVNPAFVVNAGCTVN